MDTRTFPAIFDPAEENEIGGFTVTFPDLPGCITEGDTLDEATGNAREAMELWLWDAEQHGETIPIPAAPQNIEHPKNAFIVPITAWMNDVRDEMSNKVVRTNVTMPRWLKQAAEDRKINFSQVLQVALKERLGIIVNHESSDDEVLATAES